MSSEDLAASVLEKARSLGVLIATAESCTGGLVAGALTAIAGSSDVFERGFTTYSNAAKIEMLGVERDLIERHGAVSAEVAEAMAVGALRYAHASLAVAVTGIAGPSGGSEEKPVGLVYITAAKLTERRTDGIDVIALHCEERFGDIGRGAIRERSVQSALRLLLKAADLS